MEQKFITHLAQIADISRLHKDFDVLLSKSACLDLLQSTDQLSFRSRLDKPNDWSDGVGSLYDRSVKTWSSHTKDYVHLNDGLPSSFVQLFSSVSSVVETFGLKVGRFRLMRQRPKTCLSLHKDPEELRFHVPLYTNENTFFVCGKTKTNMRIETMPLLANLYTLQTEDWHTVVNADLTSNRMHFVFDTWKI
jgi:Aspartyl/Asparaginyl beta-hydroxylase